MKVATQRHAAVWIRKSGDEQNDEGQKTNVETMLKEIGVHVPERFWFVSVVSRRKVAKKKKDNRFPELISLVEAGQIHTVYIESQDRWGTNDRKELFHFLHILRENRCRLIDLRKKLDYTSNDMATELQAFLGSYKSEIELIDISYRSLRSRVAAFKERSNWPGGTQPYGYDKANYAPDRTLNWVWHPTTSRHLGQLFFPDKDGNLQPGPAGIKIPKKEKTQTNLLRPSLDKAAIETVQLIFELYVYQGLTRRQIAYRLNAEGRTMYGVPFNHCNIGEILQNEAYQGDTVFGKVQVAELNAFDVQGMVNRVENFDGPTGRSRDECIVRPETHVGIIERKVFRLAQQRLARELRKNFPGRNPAYWLKPLLRCGHCGGNMTGRNGGAKNKKEPTYVCLSYVRSQASGQACPCGYQAITHKDAEKLIMDKLASIGHAIDNAGSDAAKINLECRERILGEQYQQQVKDYFRLLGEGIKAYGETLKSRLPEDTQPVFHIMQGLQQLAGIDEPQESLASLKEVMRQAEAEVCRLAKEHLQQTQKELRAVTLAWAKASEGQAAILKEEADRLEDVCRHYQEAAIPIWERLGKVDEAMRQRSQEIDKLQAEWPQLEVQAKAEALKRILGSVTLFWEKEWHPANEKNKRRKTKRPGRFWYKLLVDKIVWEFSKVDASCCRGTCSRNGR